MIQSPLLMCRLAVVVDWRCHAYKANLITSSVITSTVT